MNQRLYWVLIIGGWGLQCVLSLMMPYVADESYYAIWGHSLSLGYLDHPPAVALWSRWGGRGLNLTLLPIAWLLYIHAGRTLALKNAHWLAPLIFWTPLGLASGVIVTPDSPLLLAWAIAIWGYARGLWWVSAVGIALGLWSKPMMWIAVIGLGKLWWSDPQPLKSTSPSSVSSSTRFGYSTHFWCSTHFKCLLIMLTALLLYTPHIIWSIDHQGFPWTFQGERSFGRLSLFEFLLGQLWVATPIWAWIGVRLLLKPFKEQPAELHLAELQPAELQINRILWWLSAPTILVWLGLSLITRVEANWTALAWPPLLLWILHSTPPPLILRGLKIGVVLTLPLIMIPVVHLLIPLGWGPPRDGVQLLKCARSVYQGPLIAGRYQEASLISIVGGRVHYLKAVHRRMSEFDLHPEYLNFKNNTQTSALHLNTASPLNPPVPSCGYLYLGPPKWLGDQCISRQSSPSSSQASLNSSLTQRVDVCGLQFTKCECQQ